MKKSYHSICAWTFNAGKGGFTPSDSRPAWSADNLNTVEKIKLINQAIRPRLPGHIVLGFEAHYNNEFDEENAAEIADALVEAGIYLAMVTPGAHGHFAYGGICSPDQDEQEKAKSFGRKTVEITYSQMKKAWHPEVPPALVLWNGSFGYDLATTGVGVMYRHLKKAIAELCRFEKKLGGELYVALEPKPNEGHPAMLLPTVASAIVFWRTLEREFAINLDKKGINKEFGHS
jgi:xylose isomerase